MAEKRNGPQMGPPGRGGAPRGAKMMKLDKNAKATLGRLFGIIFKNYKLHFAVVIVCIAARTEFNLLYSKT